MTQIILIIVGIAIVALLVFRRSRNKIVGICVTALDQTVRKNANKEKVLAFLRERARSTNSGQAGVSNEEIREYLRRLPVGREVSRRSVVRYLDELEREGKVEQVGDIGRGVVYRLK